MVRIKEKLWYLEIPLRYPENIVAELYIYMCKNINLFSLIFIDFFS
jgi:hypothetical protein